MATSTLELVERALVVRKGRHEALAQQLDHVLLATHVHEQLGRAVEADFEVARPVGRERGAAEPHGRGEVGAAREPAGVEAQLDRLHALIHALGRRRLVEGRLLGRAAPLRGELEGDEILDLAFVSASSVGRLDQDIVSKDYDKFSFVPQFGLKVEPDG
jgi:hypothetical protein